MHLLWEPVEGRALSRLDHVTKLTSCPGGRDSGALGRPQVELERRSGEGPGAIPAPDPTLVHPIRFLPERLVVTVDLLEAPPQSNASLN